MSSEFGADKIVMEFVGKKEKRKIFSNSGVSIKNLSHILITTHLFLDQFLVNLMDYMREVRS